MHEEIERLFETRAPEPAFAALRAEWASDPSLANAQYVIGKVERYGAALALIPCRLAILRAFTVEPLIPVLRAAAYMHGIDLQIHLGEYNSYATEMLDPQSELYRFRPQIAIVALNTAAAAPELWEPADPSETAFERAAERVSADFESIVAAFRRLSTADLVVHSLDVPERPVLGALDETLAPGQTAAISGVNDRLRALAHRTTGVYVLDYDSLVARYGRALWCDRAKWQRFRLPATASHLRYLAQEWLRFIAPLTSSVAKAAVVDLDNTLWGGIVGEDGSSRLHMGPEFPGSAYRAVQQALLTLRARGIVLAICSKNNPAEAMAVLERHPDMLLRPNDFAAIRINWEPKSVNLSVLAQELNVGLDALAFIDDNPVERLEVQAALPQVRVVHLPPAPENYARAILEAPVFERLRISADDRARGEHYQDQRQRAQALAGASSREEFLQTLEQRAEIGEATPLEVVRIAQLTQKTNQFNLTTRRYTEADVQRFMEDPQHEVTALKLRDRFGDNGLVGVAITHDVDEVCELRAFLLSCRVIGRGAETALLAHVARRSKERGKNRLRGAYRPTQKNAPAKSFLADHGFTRVSESEDGSVWELDLREAAVEAPSYITLASLEGMPA